MVIFPTLAVRSNHVPVIKFLLKRGAKLEARDRQNSTALILAAYEGHAEAVKVQISWVVLLKFKRSFQ
jgi:ankyrin repeat protein